MRRTPLRLAALLLWAAAVAAAPAVKVTVDHETGLYHRGEIARYTILVTDGETPLTTGSLAWRLSLDGVGDRGSGAAQPTAAGAVVTGSLDEPGILRLSVTWTDGAQKAAGLGGAGFDPELLPVSPPPDDFDAWWAAQRAALARVPLDAERVATDSADPNVVIEKLTLPVGDGQHIRGWYCRPKQPGKYPAVLTIPGASTTPVGPSPAQASRGWLSVNVSVHDQPIDESKEFYTALAAGPLADYPRQGKASRDTYYFRRVFLGYVRVLDFLTSQPEWDGQNVAVNGSSQGGGSTLVTAGLDPRVTVACANVPALCYHRGILDGRAAGWPRLIPAPDAADVIATAGYFDAAHFAARIRCPVLVTVGLIDTTCPATSVYTAYNAIPSADRQLVVYPGMGHAVPPDWYRRVETFFQEHHR